MTRKNLEMRGLRQILLEDIITDVTSCVYNLLHTRMYMKLYSESGLSAAAHLVMKGEVRTPCSIFLETVLLI